MLNQHERLSHWLQQSANFVMFSSVTEVLDDKKSPERIFFCKRGREKTLTLITVFGAFKLKKKVWSITRLESHFIRYGNTTQEYKTLLF